MAAEDQPDPTDVLQSIRNGDPHAAEQLLPLVYEELRKLAAARMAREAPGHTLQPTALVHEAYLRLLGDGSADWVSRGHFFGAAAEAMRRILVERARRAGRVKHGGRAKRVDIPADAAAPDDCSFDLLALDEALTRLQSLDRRMAEVTMLRYFAGLTNADVAQVSDVSPRTAERLWVAAKTWLRAELNP